MMPPETAQSHKRGTPSCTFHPRPCTLCTEPPTPTDQYGAVRSTSMLPSDAAQSLEQFWPWLLGKSA